MTLTVTLPVTPLGIPNPSGSAGPLQGQVLLNTRAVEDAPALSTLLWAQGATVIESPAIRFLPPQDWAPFDAMLADLRPADWIVFTSATAVTRMHERLMTLGHDPKRLAAQPIACVGPATAAAVKALGWPVRLTPTHSQAEPLLGVLREQVPHGARLWLPRAEQGREVLVSGLRAAGYAVSLTPVYRTVGARSLPSEALAALTEDRVDWVLFTASSTVGYCLALLPAVVVSALRQGRPAVACLGRVTAETAREAGLSVQAQPEQQDLPGLVASIVEAVRATQQGK